jgi:hypothetical protein
MSRHRLLRRALITIIITFASCSRREETSVTSTTSETSSTSTGDANSSSGAESPWGEEYGGHYKPPHTGCLDDEVADFAGRGQACLPACVAGQCPPASPETLGTPVCEIDLDESIPGPDHCVIRCETTEDCQGEGYTCNPDNWCSWP